MRRRSTGTQRKRGSGIQGLLPNSMVTRSRTAIGLSTMSDAPGLSPPGPGNTTKGGSVDGATSAGDGHVNLSVPPPVPPLAPSSLALHSPGMSQHIMTGNMDVNFVPESSKLSTLPTLDKLISEKDRGDVRALSDGMNRMYDLMRINYETLSSHIVSTEKRFSSLNEKLDRACVDIRELGLTSARHEESITALNASKASREQVQTLHTNLDSVKSSVSNTKLTITSLETTMSELKESQEEQARMAEQHQLVLENFELNFRRIEREDRARNERLNVQEIRSRRLHLTIEGLPEVKDTPVIQSIITRVKSDTDIDLDEQFFASAYRVGKFNGKIHKKYPRSIKIRMRDDNARDAFLASRGKLKSNPDKSQVWMNEELPDTFRRRKIMLRDLVKHINELEGHLAYIERGGINLDGAYYGPEKLDRLPEECSPARVQMIDTDKNGLAFAGEWALFSNMYRCNLVFDGIQFTSSEQCYQYRKAKYHGDEETAIDILLTSDPFECKYLGDNNVTESSDWPNEMESIMEEVNRLKYQQNPNLQLALDKTGDRVLQEATMGGTWGTNSSLRSKTTKESTGTGNNLFGKLLVKLRAELRTNQALVPEDSSLPPVDQNPT